MKKTKTVICTTTETGDTNYISECDNDHGSYWFWSSCAFSAIEFHYFDEDDVKRNFHNSPYLLESAMADIVLCDIEVSVVPKTTKVIIPFMSGDKLKLFDEMQTMRKQLEEMQEVFAKMD